MYLPANAIKPDKSNKIAKNKHKVRIVAVKLRI
jgi:hypothetical protein